MKNFVINNGAFTTNGNFSGYTALGKRVHLHKRQMESLGWTKNEEVTFPFYCIAEEKEIGQLDVNGQAVVDPNTGLAVVSKRLTALSAFKTQEDIVKAHAESSLLDVVIQKEIRTQATSAGLSENEISALASASF